MEPVVLRVLAVLFTLSSVNKYFVFVYVSYQRV